MQFTLIAVICLVIGLGSAGCGGRAAARDETAMPSADAVRVVPGALVSGTGCVLWFDLYRPAPFTEGSPAAPDRLVVLGHGFLRDRARLAGLARALARAGFPTVVPDFCNSRPWDGRPLRNALDLLLLARALDARQVVYAGFSAGGLAALLAGTLDPRARGVLGLDLVDSQGIGARVAPRLDRPLFGLAGEPSACNAGNNGLAVYAAAPRARVFRVAGAGHCDFESPTDWLCRLVCAPGAADRASPRAAIHAATVHLIRALFDD